MADIFEDAGFPARKPPEPAPAPQPGQDIFEAAGFVRPNLRPDPVEEAEEKPASFAERFAAAPPPENETPPSTGRGFLSDLAAGVYPRLYRPGAMSGGAGSHVLASHGTDVTFPEGMAEAPAVTLGGGLAVTPPGMGLLGRGAWPVVRLGGKLGWHYGVKPYVLFKRGRALPVLREPWPW